MLSWFNKILDIHCWSSLLTVKYCLPEHHLLIAPNYNSCIRLVPTSPSEQSSSACAPCSQSWHPATKTANFKHTLGLPTSVTGSCVGKTDRKKQPPNLRRREHAGLRAWHRPGSLSHTFRQSITRCMVPL